MRRTSNRALWLVVVVAALVTGWWQQHRTPSREEPQPSRVSVPEVARDAAAEKRGAPADAAGDRVAAAVRNDEERRILLETLVLIEQGGPFPYEKDGAIFSNRERRLPDRPRGYYREYTVPTPGERDRGARRVVAGREGELYYTRDHYGSFVRLDE